MLPGGLPEPAVVVVAECPEEAVAAGADKGVRRADHVVFGRQQEERDGDARHGRHALHAVPHVVQRPVAPRLH